MNIGVIGVGYISDQLVKGVFETEGSKIIAVADVIEAKAAGKAREWGAKAYFTSYDDLLRTQEVDVVFICLPHHLHAPACVAAAEAGKHILVEKPFTISISEADEVVRSVEKADVRLMVAHNQIFAPGVRKAKEFIDKGYLGKLLTVNTISSWKIPFEERSDWGWRLDIKKAGGGTLIDTGWHRIYLARHFGGNVRKVTAMTGSLYFTYMEGEDTAVALLNFDTGAIGVAQVCIANENPTPEQEWVDIRGTEGGLIIKTYHALPHLMESRGNELEAFGKRFSGETGGEVHMWFPPVNCYVEEVKHFLGCLAGDKELAVSAYDGRACVEIAQAAYKSARSERTVTLPLKG